MSRVRLCGAECFAENERNQLPMTKKKPWVVVTGDLVPTGGMDRVNYYLVRYLSERGYEIEAVAHRFSRDMETWPGVHLERVPRPGGSHFLGEPWLARAGRRAAEKIARRKGVVMVNGANCPWPDVCWVHYVHAAYTARTLGWRAWGKQMQQAYYRFQERQRLGKMRLLIANSQRTKRDLVERVHIAEEKIKVIYYGCDAQEVFPRTEEFRREKRRTLPFEAGRSLAIFVGALGDGRKGFETIYRVWEQNARKKDWDLDLLVVGSGIAQPWWEQKAREAGLSRWMHFLGFRSDVLEWIGASDLMLHPARYEAYGLGVHEAICSGIPAMVSADAGVAERLEEPWRELLLRDPKDSEELAGKIEEWKKNRAVYRGLAEVESARWRRQDREEMARQIVEVCVED
jgi:glycosyltransferase involved in cell wall biosynthesis